MCVVIDKAERLLAEAASYGSQLVVFPEAFIGGYPRGSNFGVTIGNRTLKGKEDFRKYHAAAINVPGITMQILLQIFRVEQKPIEIPKVTNTKKIRPI